MSKRRILNPDPALKIEVTTHGASFNDQAKCLKGGSSMSLDFITEKQSYSAYLEESDATNKIYKLMVKNFCEFIVNSRKLTERQVEIFLLRAKGFTFEEIGDMLGIRKQTVHESCMKTIQALKLPEDEVGLDD